MTEKSQANGIPPAVSVVTVCMNQPRRLAACLDSLYEHNRRVPFEVWVVAYRFSDENLRWLRGKYPGVNIVESNGTRGFSENNNLALRRARGRYCFCINDDTRMEMPVLDLLAESFDKQPDAAIFAPKILYPGGGVQYWGLPELTPLLWLLCDFRILKFGRLRSRWTNRPGIFRTKGIYGAAFMVRTDVFRELDFLDERYFFTPEDTALAALANRRGHACYVNAGAEIIHDDHATFSVHFLPVMAAIQRGYAIYFGGGGRIRGFFVNLMMAFRDIVRWLWWSCRRGETAREHRRVWRTLLGTAFSRATPKELFLRHSADGAGQGAGKKGEKA